MNHKITKEKIRNLLSTELIGNKILCFDSLESTNKTAKENASLPEGSVFFAERQTAGRGRLSRSWSSENGAGIYMSILLKPQIETQKIPTVTLIAGLAVCRALNKSTDDCFGIKWPNDIILHGKKVCGILAELLPSREIVIGIGVNVNNRTFQKDLTDKATSLFAEFGREFDRNAIAANILKELDSLYKIFTAGGFSPLQKEYEKLCITVGSHIRVITPTEEYNATAVGVDEYGGLNILHDGIRKTLDSGEVSVRGIMGYV